MNFSEAVSAAMDIKGMSKADLARATGYSYQQISDLLKGERRWHEKNITLVCEALSIKVSYEMEGDEVLTE